MFQVGRYDPAKEKRPTEDERKPAAKAKKRKRKSSLRVIAPEEKPQDRIKMPLKAANEAMDDLDLAEALFDAGGAAVVHEGEDREVHAGAMSQDEVDRALKMSSLPILQAAKMWKVADFLVNNLQRDGFEHFFPIQAMCIPDVIATERLPHIRARDVEIAAPTGSGKTLAYILPILNSLATRKVQRLRALIILPSRDLALQVYNVFQRYTEGSILRVGLAIGQSDFKAEQLALTVGDHMNSEERTMQRYLLDPCNLDVTIQAFQINAQLLFSPDLISSRSGISAVDIVVCTPGRLVDHLERTPGFTLQHLRFLVIDEADRLLSQSYHSWIAKVLDSVSSASRSAYREMHANGNKLKPPVAVPNAGRFRVEPITWRRGGMDGDDTADFNTNNSFFTAAAAVCQPVQLRKFLVSATLTRDPQKLAALRLINPKTFDVHQLTRSQKDAANKYSMPEGLVEYTVECTAEQKPVVLLALLLKMIQAQDRTSCVVFTSSVDSTHRLARLLQLHWIAAGYGDPSAVAEYSSLLNQQERSDLIQRTSSDDNVVSVIVCSDGMSRGMDIPDVTMVINYDLPSLAKTYVHRCGRTARAGKAGTAISLLKGGQVGQFRKVRQLIQSPEAVQSRGVKKNLVRDALPFYKKSLRALKDVLEAEENGELEPRDMKLGHFVDDEE